MKKLLLASLFILSVTAIFAQQAAKVSKGRPNIPGTFQLDFGFNRLTERPSDIKIGFWGSRTLNLYYFHDIRIGKSKFSVHPGIGFGFDRYKFIDYKKSTTIGGRDTVVRRLTPTLVIDQQGNTDFLQSASLVYDANDSLKSIKKSHLVTNFLDIPLEIRFSTNPYDPSRSFRVAIGGRVGFLINSHTKLKYSDDGETKKIKDEQNFNLIPVRYAATLRIGAGNFNVFCHYNLNPLFEKDKGPDRTSATNYTIGISLAGF
jgi:Outer membrane protein beta-barrel domain